MPRFLRRATLASIVVLAIAAAPNAPDVSLMFRGTPAHTGVANGRLFDGQGGVRWRFQTRSAVRSTPAVTATRIFIGSGDSTLYALDRTSGRLTLRFFAGSPVHSSPAVANGLVIAATLGGRIFAVSEATGAIRWSLQTGTTLPKNIAPAGEWDLYVSSPVVVGQTIVIGAGDGHVYALDLTSGKERWRVKTGGKVRATPSVKDGVAVVGSFEGRVSAIDVAAAKTRWVHHTVGDSLDLKREGYDRRAIQSTAAIADDLVFFGSRDDGVYALELATGARKWRSSHGTSWVVGSPAVRDGKVYVGSGAALAPRLLGLWQRPHPVPAGERRPGVQCDRAGPRAQWQELGHPLALVRPDVRAPDLPRVRAAIHTLLRLGARLLRTPALARQGPSRGRPRAGVQVDPGHLALLAGPHAVRRGALPARAGRPRLAAGRSPPDSER